MYCLELKLDVDGMILIACTALHCTAASKDPVRAVQILGLVNLTPCLLFMSFTGQSLQWLSISPSMRTTPFPVTVTA